MPHQRSKLGTQGEAIALQHLQRLGMTLEARNWHGDSGELDLIMQDEGALVFVEVRTRHASSIDLAAESIHTRKQQRLVALAYEYLETLQIPENTTWRIDAVVIALRPDGRVQALEHLQHAVGEPE